MIIDLKNEQLMRFSDENPTLAHKKKETKKLNKDRHVKRERERWKSIMQQSQNASIEMI